MRKNRSVNRGIYQSTVRDCLQSTKKELLSRSAWINISCDYGESKWKFSEWRYLTLGDSIWPKRLLNRRPVRTFVWNRTDLSVVFKVSRVKSRVQFDNEIRISDLSERLLPKRQCLWKCYSYTKWNFHYSVQHTTHRSHRYEFDNVSCINESEINVLNER